MDQPAFPLSANRGHGRLIEMKAATIEAVSLPINNAATSSPAEFPAYKKASDLDNRFSALGQQKLAKEQIVGAWTLMAVTSELEDGQKGEPFGPSPKGVIIFSSDGHFSLFQSRAEIPKIAANDRSKATPEEAQSIVASSIAYFGTYSIDENTKVMVVNLSASTYANVAAIPNQKRTITLLTADELKFDNPRTPNGMTLRTAWKRASAP